MSFVGAADVLFFGAGVSMGKTSASSGICHVSRAVKWALSFFYIGTEHCWATGSSCSASSSNRCRSRSEDGKLDMSSEFLK